MSTTLAAARSEVAARAQEFISGTASGGSTTTLADVNTLTHQNNYWDESVVLMTSGTNVGTQRRVQTFTAATSALTFYSAMTGANVSGAGYELYRRFSPTDVDRSINRSINIGAPEFREKARALVTASAGVLQYVFPTGPDLMDRGLVGVEYQFYTDPSLSTYPFQKLAPNQWEVIEDFTTSFTVKTLQLNFNPSQNRLLRLIYDGPLGNVATGTDIIHLDLPELEWLYAQSVAELWRIESSRTVDSNRRSAVEELARAEAFADRLRRQLGQSNEPKPIRRTSFNVVM